MALELVGTLPGEFSVSNTGAAQYEISITAPSATGGVRPDLSLIYNHRAGTGIAGQGWTIGGLSRITRCPKTLAQDGQIGGVQFDQQDRYCLDGERLVAVAGTYGAAGSEYRTEIESFRRIIAYGTQGSGPKYFEVTEPDGTFHRYGHYAASSMIDSATGSAVFWSRNQTRDTNANYIDYTYSQTPWNGAMYLVSVEYTRHNTPTALSPRYRLVFDYEQRPVSDRRTGYMFGHVWSKEYRLSTIEIDGLNANNVWDNIDRYALTYAIGASGRSQLTRVQRFSGDDSLPATTFNWQNSIPSWNSAVSTGRSSSGHSKKLVGDFNNDGFQDLFVVNNGTWHVLRGTQTGFQAPLNTNMPDSSVGIADTFDFNGDGMTDLVLKGDDGKWHIYKSTGTGMVNINTGIDTVSQNGKYAQDVNGDGLDDLLYRTFANVYLLLSDGTGLNTPAIEVITGGSGGPKGIDGLTTPTVDKQVDLNGDGLGDLLTRYKVGRGIFKWAANVFDGSKFVTYYTFPDGASKPRLEDVNGDGLLDAVYHINGDWTYHVNTGKSFAAASGAAIPDSNPSLAIFADYDADGRKDLIRATSSAWIVHKSNGNGFVTNGISIGGPDPLNSPAIPMDANGDGHHELVLSHSNLWKIRHHKSPLADVIAKFTDGFANTVEPTYASTPQMSHYYNTGSLSVAFPNKRFNTAFALVDSYKASNGIGGTYTMDYKYWDALQHAQGRGFLGFRVIRKIDSRDGTYRQPYFSQTWPYIGVTTVKYFRQSESNHKNFRIVDPVWAQTTLGSGSSARRFRRIEKVTVREFEVGGAINGQEVRRVVHDPAYETTYGNKVSEVITTTSPQMVGQTFTTTRNFQYANYTTPWCLGLPTEIEVIRSATGASAITRREINTFDSSTCRLLTTKNTSEANTAMQLKRTFTYDGFGNVKTITADSANGAAADRKMEYFYDTFGQFPQSRKFYISGQPAAEAEWTWDYQIAQRLSETDVRGQTTAWAYDSFGKLMSENRPDGTSSTFTYTACPNCWVSGRGRFHVQRDDSDGFSVRDYRDWFGRSIGGWREVRNGEKSQIKINFDARGLLARAYLPWVAGEPAFFVDYAYDLLGRVIEQDRPVDESLISGATTTFEYQGLTHTVTNPENQATVYQTDPLGRLVSVTDDLLGVTEYEYTAFDQLRNVWDPADSVVTIGYNNRGDKVSFSDPDLGSWSYQYNVFGELTGRTDAKAQATTYSYNQLGLLTNRIEAEGTTTWGYYTSSDYKLWLPASVSAPGGFSENYTYDSLSRPASVITTIDGIDYTTSYAYHTTGGGKGKLKRITYPTSTGGVRFKADYDYDAWGQLEKVKDGDSPTTIYYKLHETDALGRQRLATFGNGLDEDKTYDRANGYLTAIATGPNLSATVQNLSYEWDRAGNLTRRADLNQSKTEDFTYDDLNRLTMVQLNGATTLSVKYNNVGNITYKSDVGTYSYATGANAVTSISGTRPGTYNYDANGNMVDRNGDSITWFSYNKPKRVNYGSDYAEFKYGPDRRRFEQVSVTGGAIATTHYIGSHFEKEVAGGITRYRHNIIANGRALAILTRSTDGLVTILYVHRDHESNVVAVTDSSEAIAQGYSFDAFGKRRNTDWTADTSDDQFAAAQLTERGYTGHEHLDNTRLIHMNGRVQDPIIGRMLSADPYVPNPIDGQSYNRFSYVLNNPLSLIDPSGFEDEELPDIMHCEFEWNVRCVESWPDPGLDPAEELDRIEHGDECAEMPGLPHCQSQLGMSNAANTGEVSVSTYEIDTNIEIVPNDTLRSGRPMQLPEKRLSDLFSRESDGRVASLQGGVSVFAGIIGVQSMGGVARDSWGNVCTIDTQCFNIGLGGFAGLVSEFSYGRTAGGPLREGTQSDSVGFFLEKAFFGGFFSSVAIGDSDISGGAGGAAGIGAAAGISFCSTTVHDCL